MICNKVIINNSSAYAAEGVKDKNRFLLSYLLNIRPNSFKFGDTVSIITRLDKITFFYRQKLT